LLIFVFQLSHEQPPPSIIDFEVPFNDDMSKFRKLNNIQAEIITANSNNNHNEPTTVNTHNNRKNILTNNYNPNNSDFILRRYNKNILGSTYNNTGASASGNGGSNLSSRPSHKTHVEIITKNGATKKPNIIVNNYNPDFIYATNTNNNNMNDNRQDMRDFMAATNGKSSMNDRKSTCMLYLQADHTFFQKMGSNEASIETITRHVQRANTIYKVTGEWGFSKVSPD
jgi:disintegrin and metalloproteinase domain-containing protein 10